MLRIKMVKGFGARGREVTFLKMICHGCKTETFKEVFFEDLYANYPIKCEICGSKLAPIHHIFDNAKVRILWHKHNGNVKSQFGGDVWAPLAKIVPDE